MSKYTSQCSNGSCSCQWQGKEVCRCSYALGGTCKSCCPPWAPLAL
jgi:hypothetical protein